MKIIKGLNNYQEKKQCFLTIGTFDGVHIGHQKIIKALVEEAHSKKLLAVVLTFFPHPRIVLQKKDTVKLIDTIDEKKSILEALKVDVLVIHPFSKSFSRLSSIEFTGNILVGVLKIRKLFIGFDHRFGKNREASINDLIEYGNRFNFKLKKFEAESLEMVNISSTKIRNSLLDGNIKLTNKFLGRLFNLNGTIIMGDGLGRKIGFPTANISVKETYKILPKNGVYFVHSFIERKKIFGMMNIGIRPTVDGKNKSIEVHFFNFNKILYTKKINVFFHLKIRDEIKFNSIKELKIQLKKDKITCIELTKKNNLEI